MDLIHRNVGGSLGAIAQRELGDFTLWREIADENELNIFGELPTTLEIPDEVSSVVTEELGNTGDRDISEVIKKISWIL